MVLEKQKVKLFRAPEIIVPSRKLLLPDNSLIRRHRLLKNTGLIPFLIRTDLNNSPGTATSWTATIGAAPIEGNIQIFCFGGIQTRTTASPSGTGWVQLYTIVSGGLTNDIWARIAPSGAATSYTLSWSGGNLQGTWVYFEVSNCSMNLIVSQQNPDSGATRTSAAVPTYDVYAPAFAVSGESNRAESGQWTADNGFTNLTTSFRHNVAYKIYNRPVTSETTTWSGASDRTSQCVIALKGKS